MRTTIRTAHIVENRYPTRINESRVKGESSEAMKDINSKLSPVFASILVSAKTQVEYKPSFLAFLHEVKNWLSSPVIDE